MDIVGSGTALQHLENWTASQDGKAIMREFKFDSFITAFSFMTACAIKAEKMNHHPEWFNVYNTVKVELTTHDAGDVTTLDLELAVFMDMQAGALSVPDNEAEADE